MRDSAARRYALALFLAIGAAVLIHYYNPMDHLKADLRADAQGIRLSFEVATDVLKSCPVKGTGLTSLVQAVAAFRS